MKKYKYRHKEVYNDVPIDIRADTTEDLIRKVEKKKKQIDRQTVSPDTTLSDFGMRYLDTYKKPAVSDAWYKMQRTMLMKHIVGGIKDKKVGKIRPIEIQQMLNNLDASSEYINKVYNLTCQIFRYAYKNGLTPRDFSDDLEKPKGRPPQPGRSLSDFEQRILVRVLSGHRMETMCKLMLYCGLRTGEARSLIWKDVDLNSEVIHIRGTKTANADRMVPIPEHFVQYLRRLNRDPFSLVVGLSKQQAEAGWRNVKRLMNIEMGCKIYRNKLVPPYPLQEPCRLYDLRHTYCTNLEAQGVPISIASRLMGHSDISLTARIYTHENDQSLELARSLINGIEGKTWGKKSVNR